MKYEIGLGIWIRRLKSGSDSGLRSEQDRTESSRAGEIKKRISESESEDREQTRIGSKDQIKAAEMKRHIGRGKADPCEQKTALYRQT